jgi:hypothetical protein
MYVEFSYPEYLADGRDWSVIRFHLPPKTVGSLRWPPRDELPAVHLCVLWDHDRDQRMLALLAVVYLRNREMLEQLVAVAESRGRIDFWCRSEEHRKDLQRALDDASEAVMFRRAWKANPGKVVPCKGTAVDWQALPDGTPDALRSVAKGHGLGIVPATKNGARRAGAL